MTPAEVLFRSFDAEIDQPLVEVQGHLPDELRGTFLRAGPGLLQLGKDPLALLDGLGMVAALHLGDGPPRLTARLIQSPALAKARAANRQVERFVFTNLPQRWRNLFNLKLGNAVSHAVYAWAGRLHATDAFGHMALDPRTLQTLGPSDLTGAWSGPPVNTSQMMRYCPATDRLVTTLVAGAPGKGAQVQVFEVDRQGAVARRSQGRLPTGTGNAHDLAVTPQSVVLFQFGSLSLPALLWGKQPGFDAIGYDPQTTPQLVIVPRAGGATRHVPLPGLFFFHMFNAFETEAGDVVVDACVYPGKPSFASTYPPALRARHQLEVPVQRGPRPTRITVSASGAVSVREVADIATEAPSTQPQWHGRPSRYGWSATLSAGAQSPDPGAYFFFDSVAKVDFAEGGADLWTAGPGRFVSPVQMVPRPHAAAEDDGWLLAWVLDAERQQTEVVVLDAAQPSRGPLAVIKGGPAMPAVSHVHFAAADAG